jgi:hypothetical protein
MVRGKTGLDGRFGKELSMKKLMLFLSLTGTGGGGYPNTSGQKGCIDGGAGK